MTTGRINQGASCVRSLALGERHAPVSRPYVRTTRASSSGVFALAATRERKNPCVLIAAGMQAGRRHSVIYIFIYLSTRESRKRTKITRMLVLILP